MTRLHVKGFSREGLQRARTLDRQRNGECTHCPEHDCELDARGACPGCTLGGDETFWADVYPIFHEEY